MSRRQQRYTEPQIQSQEVQELLGQVPTRIHRIGLYLFLSLIVVVFVMSYIFKYPDVVQAEIRLSPSQNVQPVVAHSSAYLSRLYVGNGTYIREGEVIAELSSGTQGAHLQRAKAYAQAIQSELYRGADLAVWVDSLRQSFVLGELEPSYQAVVQSLERLALFETQQYYYHRMDAQQKLNDISHRISQDIQAQAKLTAQRRELFVAQKRRDSILHSKGLIADEALERVQSEHLSYLEQAQTQAISEKQYLRSSEEGKIALFELKQKEQESKEQLYTQLASALSSFLSSCATWEERYLLTAKVAGTLYYWGSRHEQQHINAGDRLFTISSEIAKEAIGVLSLTAFGAGKVQVGQRVIVRLNNYPDVEYGTLEARVRYISPTADEQGLFRVEVAFPEGLRTSYNQSLPTTLEAMGQAEVITSDKRLIERLLAPIYRLFSQNT